jgi:hypothetical protein
MQCPNRIDGGESRVHFDILKVDDCSNPDGRLGRSRCS